MSHRVVVFASASPNTPRHFLDAARELGDLIATEGHICVNGGGNLGSMGALNTSLKSKGGKITTVIHRRWVVDGEDFDNASGESLVVDGNDLSERKRKMIEGASCVIVLPGGLGTLDELMDVACLKQLGFIEDIPICLVNIDGYYDGFEAQLKVAHETKLISQPVGNLIQSAPTAKRALAFCTSKFKALPVSVAQSPRPQLSFYRLAKAFVLLPVILVCYTCLFVKTVNFLMSVGGEISDAGPTETTLPASIEFFGLVGILLLTCKYLK